MIFVPFLCYWHLPSIKMECIREGQTLYTLFLVAFHHVKERKDVFQGK